MLVHFFWLFEFKFMFEFNCLSSILLFKLFPLTPQPSPFWPDFSCSPSARSPPVHLFFFGPVHHVAAQHSSRPNLSRVPAQPLQCRRPTTPPPSPAAADTTRFSPYCNKSLRQHHYFSYNRGYYCIETVIWLQFVCLLQHKI
jgi:hypothetical protein